jgi:RimJ/RimL family protein N-acetyltransferase
MQLLSLETSRLNLRWLTLDDAAFILELVNDPDWIRFIGDKSVTDLDAARNYLETGPLAMYRRHGFGLNRVALKTDDVAVGICGVLQRASLAEPDLGFAFLPEFRRRGYALEAAQAILEHTSKITGSSRFAAIVSPQNIASAGLLEKLGFNFERNYQAEPNASILDLYVIDLNNE